MPPTTLTRATWDEWLFSDERATAARDLATRIPSLGIARSLDSGWITKFGAVRMVALLYDLLHWGDAVAGAVVESAEDQLLLRDLRDMLDPIHYVRGSVFARECREALKRAGRAAPQSFGILLRRAETWNQHHDRPVILYPDPLYVDHHTLALPTLGHADNVVFEVQNTTLPVLANVRLTRF